MKFTSSSIWKMARFFSSFFSASVYYYAEPINHVKRKCLLSKRRTKRRGKCVSPKSLLLFRCCTSVLMLSLGKLMKMCGVFISCESLTNRNLIAPFFVVLVVLFFRQLKGKKPLHFKLARPCEVHHLWIFSSHPYKYTMTL